MKELLKDLLIATLTAFAIPLAIYIGLRVTGLKNVATGTFRLGQRLSAPAVQGGRNVSGRIAHWGAGRGVVGRTVARVATGAVFVGGRRALEREGEKYRKGNIERMVSRGMYRMQPSGKMNAELLEKVTPDAIARWVNSDDPNTRKAVEQLRQMVVMSRGTIKLSTAQRDALFSGGGGAPLTEDGPLPGMSPIVEEVPPGAVPGGPTAGGLAGIRSAHESRSGLSRYAAWLASERPTIVPGLRQRGQSVAGWLMGHGASWGGWTGRPASGGAAPASPAPMPPPPPPPGSPLGTPPGPSPVPPASPSRGPGYKP